jgi:hypothetical protein
MSNGDQLSEKGGDAFEISPGSSNELATRIDHYKEENKP